MKLLKDCYTETELRHVIEFLKDAARAEPGTRKAHVLLNGLRVSVQYDPARSEFRAYVGCPQQHPDRSDLSHLQALLGAPPFRNIMPREYTHHGTIHYAPGFAWDDIPPGLPTSAQPEPERHETRGGFEDRTKRKPRPVQKQFA